MRLVFHDLLAGLVASILVVAYALSYSALIFHGDMVSGAPRALWGMMLAAALCGAWCSWRTTIPPIANGADTAFVATLVALAATVVSTVGERGGTTESSVRHALLALSFAGVAYSALATALGALNLAGHLRLVPFGVVAGFLTASGCVLALGGVRLSIGAPATLASFASLSHAGWLRLAIAAAIAAATIVLRARIVSGFALPALILGSATAVHLARHVGAPYGWSWSGWFLGGADLVEPWLPLAELGGGRIDWRLMASLAPEALAIACVGIVSNIVRIVGLEMQRGDSADLNVELRAIGWSNLLVAFVGGLPAVVVTAPTNLLREAGAKTRWAGFACAAIVGAALLLRVDLPGFAPLPVLGGLVAAMGLMMVWASIRPLVRQHGRGDLAFALVVAAACVGHSFAGGVLLGFVGACLIFAFNYSRIGVVRRRATRATVGSHVEYAPAAERYLRDSGDAIQIYWLSGYIFFGSTEAVFESVRAPTASRSKALAYVVFDLSGVPGLDASAVQGLVKLRRFLDSQGVRIAWCGLRPHLSTLFARNGLFGGSTPHQAFGTRNEALEWCERRLLAAGDVDARGTGDLETMFFQRLRGELDASCDGDMAQYLRRCTLDGPAIVYEQGAPADEMNFVISGCVRISLRDETGALRTLREMRQNTIVGEMGFFRGRARSATVSVDGPAVLYMLSRADFERMRLEQPALAAAFAGYIVRTLADRLEFANREIASLAEGAL